MNYHRIFEIIFISIILLTCLSFGGIEPLPQTITLLAVLVSISIYIIWNLMKGRLELHLPLFLIPLFAFIAFCVLQLFFQIGDPLKSPLFPHTIYRYETRNLLFLFIGYFAFFYSTIHSLQSLRQIKKIILILGSFAFLFSVFSIIQKLSGSDSAYWTRKMPEGFYGSFFNPTNASNWLMMIFILMLGYVIEIIKKRRRFSFSANQDNENNGRHDSDMLPLLILFLIVNFGAIFFSGSRGSVIVTIFSSGFLVIISFARRIPLSAVVALIVALFVISAVITASLMSNQSLYSDGDQVIGLSQYEYRLSIWSYTTKSIGQNPLFGSGLGTYRYNVQKFLPWDYPLARKYLYLNSAHNEYLELISDTGIIGSALFIAFIILFLAKMLKKLISRRSRKARSIGYSGIAVIIAMALHSLFDFNLRIPANGFLFAGICAIAYFAIHCHSDGSISIKKTGLRLDKWFGLTASIIVSIFTVLIAYVIACPLIAKHLDPVKKDEENELLKLEAMDNNLLIKRLESAIGFDPLNGAHRFHLAKARENDLRRILNSSSGVVFDSQLYYKISDVFYEYFNTLSCHNSEGYYHMSLGFFAMLFVDYPEMAEQIFMPPSTPFDPPAGDDTFFNMAIKHLEYAVKIDPSNPDLHRGLYMGCFYLASRARRDGDIETAERLISLGRQASKRFIQIVPVYYDDDGVKRASAEQALRLYATYISTDRDEMNSILPESREDLHYYTDRVLREILQ